MSSTPRSTGPSRREMLTAVAAAATSGLLLLLAANRMQAESTTVDMASDSIVSSDGGSVVAVDVTRTVGWLLVAAVAAIFATSGWARRLVGVVMACAAVAAVVTLAVAVVDGDVTGSPWVVSAMAAGLVGIGVGALTCLRARQWPGWSARFDSADRPRASTPGDQWRALDRGEDPTARD